MIGAHLPTIDARLRRIRFTRICISTWRYSTKNSLANALLATIGDATCNSTLADHGPKSRAHGSSGIPEKHKARRIVKGWLAIALGDGSAISGCIHEAVDLGNV